MNQDRIRFAILALLLTIGALCTEMPAMAEVDWAADPFEELRDEYFADQSAVGDVLIAYEPGINSTLALCFEYNDGSLVVIPFDDVDLINVSLRINGTEVAKYPTVDILKVVRREMKDIVERLSAS